MMTHVRQLAWIVPFVAGVAVIAYSFAIIRYPELSGEEIRLRTVEPLRSPLAAAQSCAFHVCVEKLPDVGCTRERWAEQLHAEVGGRTLPVAEPPRANKSISAVFRPERGESRLLSPSAAPTGIELPDRVAISHREACRWTEYIVACDEPVHAIFRVDSGLVTIEVPPEELGLVSSMNFWLLAPAGVFLMIVGAVVRRRGSRSDREARDGQ